VDDPSVNIPMTLRYAICGDVKLFLRISPLMFQKAIINNKLTICRGVDFLKRILGGPAPIFWAHQYLGHPFGEPVHTLFSLRIVCRLEA